MLGSERLRSSSAVEGACRETAAYPVPVRTQDEDLPWLVWQYALRKRDGREADRQLALES